MVHDKLEIVAEQLFEATAFVRAECPFESLFFLRSYLQDTPWCSFGQEEIIIAPANILEMELPQTQMQEWRQIKDPTLLFRVDEGLAETENLALSA
jgi:hypothetical protein